MSPFSDTEFPSHAFGNSQKKGCFLDDEFLKNTAPKKLLTGAAQATGKSMGCCSGCGSTWPCTGEEVLPHVKGEERSRQSVPQSCFLEKQVCSAGCQGPSGRCIEQPSNPTDMLGAQVSLFLGYIMMLSCCLWTPRKHAYTFR